MSTAWQVGRESSGHSGLLEAREPLAVTLTFDPGAEASERWLVCIGFDCYGAGPTADDALNAAMNREALGPEPLPIPDASDDPEHLPFDDWPEGDDQHDDPGSLGELPVLAGRIRH